MPAPLWRMVRWRKVRSKPAILRPPEALILPINRNWRYNPKFVEGAHDKTFDDATFQKVVVPHTNIKLPWHSFDDKDYEFVSHLPAAFQTASGSTREARICGL